MKSCMSGMSDTCMSASPPAVPNNSSSTGMVYSLYPTVRAERINVPSMTHSKMRIRFSFSHKKAQNAQKEDDEAVRAHLTFSCALWSSFLCLLCLFVALFNYRQHVASANCISRLDINRNHDSRTRRPHLVLHF